MKKTVKIDTKLIHSGRDPLDTTGAVNPPVFHASTVTFPSIAEMAAARENPEDNFVYGRRGTPTSMAFQDAVAKLEGGDRTIAVGSGLAAIVGGLLGFLKSGDHILVVDSIYAPTRNLARNFLDRFGVATTYYDPLIGAAIERLIQPETKVVFVESPGSHSFEVQDIPAIAEAAHDRGAVVIMDNTWSAGLYFQPFAHGVDVSIQAATKYIVGHSDAMLGAITVTNEHFETVASSVRGLGNNAAPDDCYLGLRGLRTLSVRLQRHQENGLKLATWFAEQPAVEQVLHPALPSCPGHEFWKRDFTGASGLFGVIFKQAARANVEAMVDGLTLFGLGGSWGGYESLVLPTDLDGKRTATEWAPPGPCVRFHAGLEDPDDLIADLEQGLMRLSAKA